MRMKQAIKESFDKLDREAIDAFDDYMKKPQPAAVKLKWSCTENMFGWVVSCETPDIILTRQIHRSEFYDRLASKRLAYLQRQILSILEGVI